MRRSVQQNALMAKIEYTAQSRGLQLILGIKAEFEWRRGDDNNNGAHHHSGLSVWAQQPWYNGQKFFHVAQG